MGKTGKSSFRFLSLLLAMMLLLTSVGGALAAEQQWADGSYDGSAQGRNGPVEMRVTIADGQITAIETVSQSETASYWQAALGVIDRILSAQSTDVVDTITGATSSRAIRNAVSAALEQAAAAAAIGFSGGSGTSSDPYVISSVYQIHWFQGQVNDGNSYAGQYIELGRDITLSEPWTPIGTDDSPFAGSFDGQGHTISGLSIGSEEDRSAQAYAGLFGYALNTASLHNVRLENASVYTEVYGSTGYGGALLAYAKVDSASGKGTVIDNCFASGVVDVKTINNKAAMVGGLVGFTNQYGILTNCGANVDVSVSTGSGVLNAGGLLGYPSINTLTMNCYSLGDVEVSTSNANANAGSLAGTIGGVFYNCYAAGDVTQGGSNIRVGGLAGNIAAAGIVMNSYYDDALFDCAVKNISGHVDDSVLGKSAAELASAEFASTLGNNLSPAAQRAAKDKVETFNPALSTTMSQLLDLVDGAFYDWELTGGKVELTDSLWVPSEPDSSIFDGGDGTESNPYQIADETQLRAFAVSLNDKISYAGKYVELTDHIALTDDWTPVGEGEYAFSGTFDGNGKTISGLAIGTADTPVQDTGQGVYYGLFGVLEGATVRDLSVAADIYVTGTYSCYIGGLAGYCADSLIDGVSVSGTIWGKTTHAQANNFVGGALGMQYKGQLINSVSSADVRAEAVGGLAEAGGLIGLNNRALTANCFASGDISGTAKRGTENGVEYEGMAASGGIAGVHAGNMVNCYATGDTSSDNFSYYVGALAGWVTGIGNLYDSYFNTESSQTIENQTVNPVVAAGWLVGPGVNDEGEPYAGSISYQVVGLTAAEMAGTDFAARLNSNFSAFPIDLATDYPDVTLRQWTLTEAVVLPTGEAASVTYVKPDIELPVAQSNYVDGVYYGRSEDKTLIINLTIQEGLISAIDAGGDYSSAVAAIIDAQGTDTLDTGTEAMQRLKSAVDAALKKAKIGDTTGYGQVNPAIFAGGSGTQASPYRIATEAQLRAFAAAINTDEDFAGKFIELRANITLTQAWIPAGSNTPHPFSGNFNGNGYTISNLIIGSSQKPAGYQYAGLFAYIENGTVTDLTLKNVDITTENSGSSRIYAGALTGFVDQSIYTDGTATGSSGYIDNVTVTGKLSVSSNSGAAYAAGLAASVIRGAITNCTVDMNITCSSKAAWAYAGGITGVFARAGIINNRISGAIVSSAPLNKTAIGGVGGFHSGVSFNNFADIELVSVGSTGDVGALAGRNTGIALMLPGYFNNERLQKAGNTEYPGVGVGTVIVGERDGMGAVQGLTGKTEAEISAGDVTALLNTGIADTATLAQATDLMTNSWKVSLPSEVKLLSWEQSKGTAVLKTTTNSGGSSTGGGGGSSASSPTASSTTTSGSRAITTLTPNLGADGKAAADVSAAQMSDALAQAQSAAAQTGDKPHVEIKIAGSAGANVVQTTIPGASVQSLVFGGVTGLTVSSDLCSVTFDGSALGTIAGASSGDMVFTAARTDTSSLSDTAKQAVGNRPVYEFSVTSGGETVSQFGGSVTVSLPYTPAAGEDTNAIVIYYINAQGGLETVTNGRYDAATGTVVFSASHFSNYAVGYNKVSFNDVSDAAWYADAVTFLAARNITSGTTATAFSPDTTLTRGQFIALLLRAYGIAPDETAADNFADSGDTYYTGYLAAAKRLGISSGVGGNLFAPDRAITRQEMFTMLYNALKVLDQLPENGDSEQQLSDFTDSADVASYAREAMDYLVNTGVISGSNGLLDPAGASTRAQMAQVLFNLLKG
ncbi:MAG TPA: S-layer homology domain-containing protein [Syntrophomonas sp.]|nr:S-layer homology domain-containing protein [Syntrophomonas sp.]